MNKREVSDFSANLVSDIQEQLVDHILIVFYSSTPLKSIIDRTFMFSVWLPPETMTSPI
jgi:hypothetical protein